MCTETDEQLEEKIIKADQIIYIQLISTLITYIFAEISSRQKKKMKKEH